MVKGKDKENGKELATRDEAPLAIPVQEGPQLDPLSKTPADQLSLPRIKVLQPMSAEVVRDEEPFPVGTFYETVTKTLIGVKGRRFYFIAFKQFLTRVRMEVGRGLLCRSTNLEVAQMVGGRTIEGKPTSNCGLCVLRLWPEERVALGENLKEEDYKKGPPCSVVNNYLALEAPETPNGGDFNYRLLLLQFMRTSSKAAKDLNTMWNESRRPLPDFVYSDTSVGIKGEAGAYYRQEVGRSREATDTEKVLVAQKMKQLGLDRAFIERIAEVDVSPEEAGTLSGKREANRAEAERKGF